MTTRESQSLRNFLLSEKNLKVKNNIFSTYLFESQEMTNENLVYYISKISETNWVSYVWSYFTLIYTKSNQLIIYVM